MDMSFSEWMGALGQVAVVAAAAFLILCVLTSLIRFQLMSEQAMEMEELGTSEERGFRLIVVNQIAQARRAQNPLTVALLQLPEGGAETGEVEAFIKPILRETDLVLACGSRRIGILFNCGSDQVEVPIARIMEAVNKAQLAGADQWRFGVSGYPEHGYKTSVLYARSEDMLKAGGEEGALISGMASAEDVTDSPHKIPAGAIDELTGLISEDKMLGIMRRFIAQERRQDLPVSMIYMMIDQPDRLLDVHGKPAMDEVIKELAAYIDRNVRETDIVARMGETGFVMVHAAKPASSMILFQRIGEAVRRMAFRAGGGMKVSLSAGVAGYPDVIGTVVQYFVAAETALHVAQSRGRNQCVRFDRSLQGASEDEKSLEQI